MGQPGDLRVQMRHFSPQRGWRDHRVGVRPFIGDLIDDSLRSPDGGARPHDIDDAIPEERILRKATARPSAEPMAIARRAIAASIRAGPPQRKRVAIADNGIRSALGAGDQSQRRGHGDRAPALRAQC